jgi:hypothetical protein
MNVHVPHAGGVDSLPGRPDDLVPGEGLGQPAVEAGIAQAVVDERRRVATPYSAA